LPLVFDLAPEMSTSNDSKLCGRFDANAITNIDRLLQDMFGAAIAVAQPASRVPQFLPAPPRGRLIVIGAGKASAAMAKAVEDNWSGPLEGTVVTRYGYAVACQRIELLEASHPVPDANGLKAAERILQRVSGLSADDMVLCLISGGGSALLPLPAEGLTLEDKQEINQALLASGASISEMNFVRRHLSAIKGGRLAAACHPARVVNLIISDVPADGLNDIASGPTVADVSTCADALAVLQRYAIDLPPAVTAMLESGRCESLKPNDPRLPHIETHLIATPQLALEAAAKLAEEAGINAYILSDAIEGEAREVGKVMAAIARQVKRCAQTFKPPCVLLSGGETTVTLHGNGRGGRNVEFLLSLGIALNGEDGIFAIAGDTDGVDGQEEIAGALLRPDTLARARAQGIHPPASLENNDAHGFFQALGDSVITGPTLTNVNDFRAIFIAAQSDNI
jgi:hydroxypyruvate reductase